MQEVTPLHRVPTTRKDRRFQNIQIPVSGGRRNLKHILVYSCAGGWISYTAGSMIFFLFLSKASKQKKCNNGADHSLCLVSFVFLYNGKTILQSSDFCQDSIKKKRKKKRDYKKQTQTSNTNVYLWENWLKLPSFSSHKAWQNLTRFLSVYHDSLQSRSFWTGWKLQRETATCDTPWLYLKKKKTQTLAHFHHSDGVRSSHKDVIFISGKNEAYIRLFTSLLWHQCSQLVLKTFLFQQRWRGEKLQSMHRLHCLRGEGRHPISRLFVWNVCPCGVSSSAMFSGSGGARRWRGAGRHGDLCSTCGTNQSSGLS